MALVIYHDHCADGFCSAWLMHRRYPDAEFHPASYGQDPPDCKDKDVFILDFSYPRETLERINGEAKSLVVLDHHKTAEEALNGLPYCTFDMDKSGAMLTWEYLYPHRKDMAPGIVRYVQDRDLWNWVLPHSREINAAIRSYPYDFEVWDRLHLGDPYSLIPEGRAILRAEKQIVDAKVSQSHEVVLERPEGFESGWWHIWQVANATTLTSETGGALAEKGGEYGIGCVWFELPSGERVYSLRSRHKLVDVSKIAKHYGGGGHCNAAGFKSFQHPWEVK